MRTKKASRGRVITELIVLAALMALLGFMYMLRGGVIELAGKPTPTPEPTAVPTSSPIPEDMFEWKEGQYVHVEYGEDDSLLIDEDRFSDLSTKNAADLVEWAKMAWENQWGYVWGTFGDVLTEDLLYDKLQQYPEGVGDYEDIIREKWMGRRVADCAGLIKGYGWYDPESHSLVYRYGDMLDWGTEDLYEYAQVKGDIDTLPEKPGIVLHGKDHVGVYIGGGYAIEAIATAGGVVKTKVADRPWLHWMECPFIQYD